MNVCKCNPFSLAELRLIKERKEGFIYTNDLGIKYTRKSYDVDDVIAYAKDIRDWIENNGQRRKRVLLTKEEKAKIRSKNNKEYYLHVVKHKKGKHGKR